MLLLAPSTASELEIGKLDLELLNSWLNEAEKFENLSKNDENRQNLDIPNYFKYLSEKFEKYNKMLEDAIEEGKFNGILSRSTVDDEKMGEDWNAMISKEEKIDSQNRESYSENVLDLKDSDQTRTYIHFIYPSCFIHSFYFWLHRYFFLSIQSTIFFLSPFSFSYSPFIYL